MLFAVRLTASDRALSRSEVGEPAVEAARSDAQAAARDGSAA